MSNDISRLDAILDGIGDTTAGEQATVKAFVEAAIAALNIDDYAKKTDLHAHANKEFLDSLVAATDEEVAAICTEVFGA